MRGKWADEGYCEVADCAVSLAAGKPWWLYSPGTIYSSFLCDICSFVAVSAAGRAIVVSEETEKSMKVTWQPAPGNVVNYRVTYKPQAGGRQLAAKVPGGTTTTVLRRLTHLTTYDITVVPVYRSGEGKARQGEGTTCRLARCHYTSWHC